MNLKLYITRDNYIIFKINLSLFFKRLKQISLIIIILTISLMWLKLADDYATANMQRHYIEQIQNRDK